MRLKEMLKIYLQHRKLLFDQGFLDDMFIQLQLMQDESCPDFAMEIVQDSFKDYEKILNDINLALNEQIVDFMKIESNVHQLKGSSSSIGLQRVSNVCTAFRGFYQIQDAQACKACLQQLNQEYLMIKENLQKLFMMEKQIVAAGGSIPPIELSPDKC